MVSAKSARQLASRSVKFPRRNLEMEKLAFQALQEIGYTELRHVEVECVGKSLIMRGIVCSFYVKQLAQETVKRAFAGYSVDNRISVVSSKPGQP